MIFENFGWVLMQVESCLQYKSESPTSNSEQSPKQVFIFVRTGRMHSFPVSEHCLDRDNTICKRSIEV